MRMNPDADMGDRGGFGEPSHAHAGAGALARSVPRVVRARSVLVVMVAFKWDLELAGREAKAVARGLYGYPFTAAMHSKRQIAYIVQTDLTAQQLLARLSEPLAAGAVECGWVFTPGADAACSLPLEPMAEKITDAWREVRRFNARLPSRRNPQRLFDRVVEIDGGTVTTKILDQHPLEARRS
jgi:hypothetical protein